MKSYPSLIWIIAYFIMPAVALAQHDVRKIKVNLRGVYESKISLIPLSGKGKLNSIIEIPGVREGGIITMVVPPGRLPGELILRFDYRQFETSTPYPSEKHIFISMQDIELWVNPLFIHNPDSTYFQPGEIENNRFKHFSQQNILYKQKLSVLHEFLLHYDDPRSRIYSEGVIEYESRRKTYNLWLASQIKQEPATFVNLTYRFQYVSKTDWEGSYEARLKSSIANYFEGIDFTDSLLVNTTDLPEWTTRYVNLYGQLATNVQLRDSLFQVAAIRAIEHAKLGHPVVYGWMVDYFYEGFTRNNLQAGISLLEKYINDPGCMTTKRLAIEQQLQGLKKLVAGVNAPDFNFTATDNKIVSFYSYQPGGLYKLLLFWSATCEHCIQVIKWLYPYSQQGENKTLLSVLAISLDEGEQEVTSWQRAIKDLPGWKHIRSKGGVKSEEARAYFVLATPVMVLVESKTNMIVALPANVDQLSRVIPRN